MSRLFTWKQKAEILVQQARCRSCGEPLQTLKNTRFNHIWEYGLGGPTETDNGEGLCLACDSVVTNGTKATSAGSSKHKIAKVRRLQKAAPDLTRALTKPCGHKREKTSRIPSRPFHRDKDSFLTKWSRVIKAKP